MWTVRLMIIWSFLNRRIVIHRPVVQLVSDVAGGREIILLCEKVAKEDIAVRFYEEQHGNILWEEYGEFQHTNVHKQVAICFRTPRYRTLEVEHPVMVNIQLKRPSDGATSESLPFELTPLDSAKRKKHKYHTSLNESSTLLPTTTHASQPTILLPEVRHYLYSNRQNQRDSNTGRLSTQCDESRFPAGGTQQFQNQYAFPTLPPTNGQPQMYLHQPQQQFQPPANMNNQQQFNVSNLIDPQDQLPQPGPSGVQAVSSFQPSGSIGEINISSPWLTMDSSELKSLMVHTLSDMKQEQQRIQQEAETLSDSFDILSTNLNNLNKP